MKPIRQAAAALLLAAALLPAAAQAETMNFSAALSGQNESPPNDSAASGQATATFDTETRELSWNVEYEGLSGPSIGAHIHGPAEPGENAGVLIPFENTQSPITGSATLGQDEAQALMDGKLYVNIHSEQHPGGELRGQLEAQK